MVAGVAILLMVWHHLFTYPNWLVEGVAVDSVLGKYADYLVWLTGRLGNICIYLFAFQSGYSLYHRPDLYDTTGKRAKRILSFLVSYWIICALFWIIGWLLDEKLPAPAGALLNMFGLEVGYYTEWINVVFAWYVLYYILLVAAAPVLDRCFRAKKPMVVCASVAGCIAFMLILACCGIDGYWRPLAASVVGILTAKYGLFERLRDAFGEYTGKVWICLVVLAVVLLSRTALLYMESTFHSSHSFVVFASACEGLIAFAFIFAFISLVNNLDRPFIPRALCFMGGISMFLWFVHGIFFTGTRCLQPYVYFSGEPIVIFLTVLAICVPVSMVCGRIHAWLKRKIIK